MEIFKDIEGYEGLYQISTHGNVKSLISGKILKPNKDRYGYLRVGLYKQGRKRKYFYIHRLVATAFIENPNNYEQINHKNEIKTDNRVENLEFCDRKYNCNYGTRNQKIVEINTNNPKLSKQVICVETGKIYPSTKEVQRQLGFCQQHISFVCNGKRKQAYGFHWKYVSLKNICISQ